MKKFLILSSVFLFVFGIVGSASAVTISYEYAISSLDNTLTTPYGWAQVETFDSALLWTWTGQGQVVSGGQPPPQYAAPYNRDLMPAADKTQYVTVPNPGDLDGSGSYKATLGGTYNYFGIFWGSVDGYNTLSFYKDNGATLVAEFTGGQITNNPNGDQSAPNTNLYVNFFDLEFDSFVMTSTVFAFEADNIAVGNGNPVPEPATMLLLGSGLVGLAGFGRKKLFKK